MARQPLAPLTRKKFTSKDFNTKLNQTIDLAGDKDLKSEELEDANRQIQEADEQVDDARSDIDYEALARADAQEPEKGLLGKIHEFGNKPLSGGWFGRTAKKVAEHIDDPNKEGFFKTTGKGDLQDWLGWGEATLRGGHRGAIEGTGNVIDEFTTPYNVAATASGFGALGAASKGAKGLANTLRYATKAASAPIAYEGAKGIYETGKRVNEKGFENFDRQDAKDLALSTATAAAGAAGMHFPKAAITARYPMQLAAGDTAAAGIGSPQGPKQKITRPGGPIPPASGTAPSFTPDSGARLDALYAKIDANTASQAELQEAANLLDSKLDAEQAAGIKPPSAEAQAATVQPEAAPKQRASRAKGGFRVNPRNMSGPQLAKKVTDFLRDDKGTFDADTRNWGFQGEEDLGYSNRTNDPDTVSLGEMPLGEIDLNQAAIDAGSDLARSVMPSRQRPGFNQRALGTGLDITEGKIQLPHEFASAENFNPESIPQTDRATRIPREGLPPEFMPDTRQVDEFMPEMGADGYSPRFDELRPGQAFTPEQAQSPSWRDKIANFMKEDSGEFDMDAFKRKPKPPKDELDEFGFTKYDPDYDVSQNTDLSPDNANQRPRSEFAYDWDEFHDDGMAERQYTAFGGPSHKSSVNALELDARGYPRPETEPDFGPNVKQYPRQEAAEPSFGQRFKESMSDEQGSLPRDMGKRGVADFPKREGFEDREFPPGTLVRHKEHGVGRVTVTPKELQSMTIQELDNYLNRVHTKKHADVNIERDHNTVKEIMDEFKRRVNDPQHGRGTVARPSFTDRFKETLGDEQGSVPRKDKTAAHYQSIIDDLDAKNAPDTAYRDSLSTGGKGSLKKGETWRGKLLGLADYLDRNNPSSPYNLKAGEVPDSVQTQAPEAAAPAPVQEAPLKAPVDLSKIEFAGKNKGKSSVKTPIGSTLAYGEPGSGQRSPIPVRKPGEAPYDSSPKAPAQEFIPGKSKSVIPGSAPEASIAEALFGRGDLNRLTHEMVVMGRRGAKDAEYQRLIPENLRTNSDGSPSLAAGETWRKKLSALVRAAREGESKVPMGSENAAAFDPDGFSAAKNDPQVVKALDTIHALEKDLYKIEQQPKHQQDPQQMQAIAAEIERQNTLVSRVVSKIKNFMKDDSGEIDLDKMIGEAEPQEMRVPGNSGNIAMGGGSPRILKVLGSSLYGKARPTVVTKELLQNSFDEHRIAGQTKPIRVHMNEGDDMSITIKDFGRGMTPDELYTKFTDVGETGKADIEDASGGFGFAKAAPMLSGKFAKVISVVNEGGKRVRYTFEGTPDQLLDQKKGVPLKREVVDNTIPTGLQVTTKFPETESFYEAAEMAKNIAEKSTTVTSDVRFSRTYGNAPQKDIDDFMSERSGSSGVHNILESRAKTFTKGKPMELQDTIKTPGANINLHFDKPPAGTQSTGYEFTTLNKGLFQTNDRGYYSSNPIPNAPKSITADIIATVEEGHTDYPFVVNRESLNVKISDAIDNWVKENIVSGAQKKYLTKLQEAYTNISELHPGANNIHYLDEGGRFTNDEINAFSSSPEFIKATSAMEQVFKNILDVADTLKWGGTNPSSRLKKFGLLFQAPATKGGNTTLGIHIPNPGDLSDSAILINLMEHLNIAAALPDPIDNLSTGLFTTITHEQAHIPGGGHDTDFAYRHAQLLDALARKRTNQLVDALGSAFGDLESGQLNPKIREILDIYNESRKRASGEEDSILATGVNSERPTNLPIGEEGGSQSIDAGGTQSQAPGMMDKIRNFMSDESGDADMGWTEKLLGERKKTEPRGTSLKLKQFSDLHPGKDIIARSEVVHPEQGYIGKGKDLPKGLMSMDLPFITSAAFRQTKPLAWSTEWFKAWGQAAKAYGDVAASQAIMRDIENSKNFKPRYKPVLNKDGEILRYKEMPSIAESLGVHLSGSKFLPGEEHFRSTLAEKMPGVWGSAIRASNRAYSTFINHMRQTKLDELLDQLDWAGGKNNDYVAKKLGQYVNDATGRGALKWAGPGGRELDLERIMPVLHNTMWAPRLFAANTKFLNPFTYTSLPDPVRKQYAIGALRMAGTWAGFAGLAYMAGAKVSLDPTSSDFGKIKVGSTRIDPAGGMQQLVVYLARQAPGKSIGNSRGELLGFPTGSFMSSASGNRKQYGEGAFPIDRASVTEDFVSSKLDPVTRLAYELMRSSSQRPVHLTDKAVQMALPIMAQDIMDAMKEDPSLERLIGSALLSSGGMGVNTYGKNERFSDPVFTNSFENAIGQKKGSLSGTVREW